jgi:hypothetical protein
MIPPILSTCYITDTNARHFRYSASHHPNKPVSNYPSMEDYYYPYIEDEDTEA